MRLLSFHSCNARPFAERQKKNKGEGFKPKEISQSVAATLQRLSAPGAHVVKPPSMEALAEELRKKREQLAQN